MKRSLYMGVLAAMMTTSVWAAPDTVLEKAETLESIVYGKVQVGALADRVNQLQDTVYGAQQSGSINARVENLFRAVEGQGRKVTLQQDVSALEWMYYDEVQPGSLVERIGQLERSVNGLEGKGSLQNRIQKLKQTIFGNQVTLTTATGTIESDQVFSLALTEPISSKKNVKDDIVHFKVAEDVMDGDTLLVPKGTPGTGQITEITKARSFGRNAKLNIVFDQVQGIDGTIFTAIQGEEAKEKTKTELKAAGASVAGAVLLGPVGLVGGFFVKGKSIDLPEGSIFYVQPESTVTISGIQVHGVDVPVTPKVFAESSGTMASDEHHETTPDVSSADTHQEMGNASATSPSVETAKPSKPVSPEVVEVVPDDTLTDTPIIVVKREEA